MLAILVVLLTACSTTSGRYKQKHDSTPIRKPSAAQLHDAIPRIETPSRGGNKHYQVRGKHYKVMPSAQGFEQTGIASWYGQKFHGHLTSNGEIYDMYAMSAAHKNLPLPTYAKVTNLANNKSVIVRVNDRGPFHQNRVIDLSYSAAYKLDMLKTGTARVHIVAITKDNIATINNSNSGATASEINGTTKTSKLTKQPSFDDNVVISSANTPPTKPFVTTSVKPFYIQVFATKNLASAKKAAQHLRQHLTDEIIYPYSNGIYRVFVSPSNDIANSAVPNSQQNGALNKSEQDQQIIAQQVLLKKVRNLGYANAFVKQKI